MPPVDFLDFPVIAGKAQAIQRRFCGQPIAALDRRDYICAYAMDVVARKLMAVVASLCGAQALNGRSGGGYLGSYQIEESLSRLHSSQRNRI